jgi:hypothetical protein
MLSAILEVAELTMLAHPDRARMAIHNSAILDIKLFPTWILYRRSDKSA